MAKLIQYLENAVAHQASDIFIIAGGSVSEKVDGHIRPFDDVRLLPPDTEGLIGEIYSLANRSMDKSCFHRTPAGSSPTCIRWQSGL